jgi:hypothetical protein
VGGALCGPPAPWRRQQTHAWLWLGAAGVSAGAGGGGSPSSGREGSAGPRSSDDGARGGQSTPSRSPRPGEAEAAGRGAAQLDEDALTLSQ